VTQSSWHTSKPPEAKGSIADAQWQQQRVASGDAHHTTTTTSTSSQTTPQLFFFKPPADASRPNEEKNLFKKTVQTKK
jgi:hypothetical protein